MISEQYSSANSNTMLEKNWVFLAGAAAPSAPALFTALIFCVIDWITTILATEKVKWIKKWGLKVNGEVKYCGKALCVLLILGARFFLRDLSVNVLLYPINDHCALFSRFELFSYVVLNSNSNLCSPRFLFLSCRLGSNKAVHNHFLHYQRATT